MTELTKNMFFVSKPEVYSFLNDQTVFCPLRGVVQANMFTQSSRTRLDGSTVYTGDIVT